MHLQYVHLFLQYLSKYLQCLHLLPLFKYHHQNEKDNNHQRQIPNPNLSNSLLALLQYQFDIIQKYLLKQHKYVRHYPINNEKCFLLILGCLYSNISNHWKSFFFLSFHPRCSWSTSNTWWWWSSSYICLASSTTPIESRNNTSTFIPITHQASSSSSSLISSSSCCWTTNYQWFFSSSSTIDCLSFNKSSIFSR